MEEGRVKTDRGDEFMGFKRHVRGIQKSLEVRSFLDRPSMCLSAETKHNIEMLLNKLSTSSKLRFDTGLYTCH